MSLSRQASQLISHSTRSLLSRTPLSLSLRHASTALPSNAVPLDEKLVRLARQTLSKAAENNASNAESSKTGASGDAESAKKKKRLETIRDALKEWQATTDVGSLLFWPFPHVLEKYRFWNTDSSVVIACTATKEP